MGEKFFRKIRIKHCIEVVLKILEVFYWRVLENDSIVRTSFNAQFWGKIKLIFENDDCRKEIKVPATYYPLVKVNSSKEEQNSAKQEEEITD